MSPKSDTSDRIIKRADSLWDELNKKLDKIPADDAFDLVPDYQELPEEEEESYPTPKSKIDWREQFRKNWPEKKPK